MAEVNHELADFLRRARSERDPLRAGLPADGRVRRVPGLRREEVALLAGVSTDYYTRLEQGRPIAPSNGVLDAVARALDLDEVSRAYLEHLVRVRRSRSGTGRSATVQRVRPGLYQFLDSLGTQPAMVLGRRTDVLATNRMGRALLAEFDSMPARERNYARWMLLSERARELFVDWEVQARSAVEALRFDAGNRPDDRGVRELVVDLSERSAEFRQWWSQHRVYQRTFGSKRLRHPIVGELTVEYESFTMPADPEQILFIFTAQAGTASGEALSLLASWAQPSGLSRA